MFSLNKHLESHNFLKPPVSQFEGWSSVVGEDLLRRFRGTSIVNEIRVLYQIGAHKFQEKGLLCRVFPKVSRFVLFEPIQEYFNFLEKEFGQDKATTILPWAIGDEDGEATFKLANNEGLSSSLLEFDLHSTRFPEVAYVGEVKVPIRKLSTAVLEKNLPLPDMLLVDTQGAEHKVIAGISPDLLDHLKILYVEASLERFYKGSKLLSELQQMLKGFTFVAYAPSDANLPTHGNAVFVNNRYCSMLRSSWWKFLLQRLSPKQTVV